MRFWRRRRLKELLRKYFDGELSPFEEKELKYILSRDREAQEFFHKMEELDKTLQHLKLKKRPPEIDFISSFRPKFRVRRIKSPALLIASTAAVFLIVVTSIILYTRTVQRYGAQSVAEVQGEQEGYVRKIFRANIPGAKSVSVVGDFNGWNPYLTPMKDLTGGGDWYAEVNVREGAHHYMFLVDGRILVPDASAGVFLPDGYGGTDSVLVSVKGR